jgi:hypothetical protein
VENALWKSPAEQATLFQQAAWGIVWWGIPFFVLSAVAFPLYAGETISVVSITIKFALCMFGGVLFGLGLCTLVRSRNQRPD